MSGGDGDKRCLATSYGQAREAVLGEPPFHPAVLGTIRSTQERMPEGKVHLDHPPGVRSAASSRPHRRHRSGPFISVA